MDRAIDLACRLLARNLETPATTEVACLSYGTPLRDAEPVLRQMLIEHGIAVSGPETGDADQFRAALRALGSSLIDIGGFSAIFYRLLPAWTEQDAAQHALILLLNELDQATTREDQNEIFSAFEKRHSRRARRPNVLAGQRARLCVPAPPKPDRNRCITPWFGMVITLHSPCSRTADRRFAFSLWSRSVAAG